MYEARRLSAGAGLAPQNQPPPDEDGAGASRTSDTAKQLHPRFRLRGLLPAIVPPTHRVGLGATHRKFLTNQTARICKLSESRGAAAKDSHPQKQRFCLAHRGGAAPHGKHRACRRWEGTWNPQQRMGLRTPQQRRGLRGKRYTTANYTYA